MKRTVIALALLVSGAAVAQTDHSAHTTTQATAGTTYGQATTTQDTTADSTMNDSAMASTALASGQLVQPSNASPERDARGIAVISDPAVVPIGWNGTSGTAMGGPLEAADDSYPACSATITDNCLQTYERGRSPR